MRIILVNKFHYKRGGAEIYYFELAKKLQGHGHKVAFFSMQDEMNEATFYDKYFVKHKEYVYARNIIQRMDAFLTSIYSIEAKNKLQRLIREFKPDLIHINNYHRQLSCSIFDAVKRCKIPIVMTAHDATSICPQIYMKCIKDSGILCIHGKYWHCLKNKCIKNSLSMSFTGMPPT